MRVQIDDNAELRKLSRAVIFQAVRDLGNDSDPAKQLDALLWLTGSDFPLWAEVIDAPFMDPFKMLSSGNAGKLRGRVYDG